MPTTHWYWLHKQQKGFVFCHLEICVNISLTAAAAATTTATTIITVTTGQIDESSHVFPSMTEVTEETSYLITSSMKSTGETMSFSEADSVVSSFQAISSSSQDISVSSTVTDTGSQGVMGSSSLS